MHSPGCVYSVLQYSTLPFNTYPPSVHAPYDMFFLNITFGCHPLFPAKMPRQRKKARAASPATAGTAPRPEVVYRNSAEQIEWCLKELDVSKQQALAEITALDDIARAVNHAVKQRKQLLRDLVLDTHREREEALLVQSLQLQHRSAAGWMCVAGCPYLQDDNEAMVACENESKCAHGGWFHLQCVGGTKLYKKSVKDLAKMTYRCEGCKASRNPPRSNRESISDCSVR